ncbi:MAG: copper homeostasis protein CutC [Muribaculaceae bacterium]|nr:copper homeostasis protein CutC [Muribaculaceae bacterium]
MKREEFMVEVCANGVESCLAAQQGGADRVELCAGIPDGGTTPSYGEIKVARRVLTTTHLHVIIRPRGGDFLYSDLEVERMAADIAVCRDLGVDGVVFGCLKADGTIDVEKNRYLMECSQGMSVTMHRAFDRAADPEQALEQIIALGFNRILTSGQQPKAIQGVDLLARLNRQAAGRIILMAGSGVTEQNIKEIRDVTGLNEFHFSGRESVPSAMQYVNPNLYMGRPGTNEASLDYTTSRRVAATIAQLLD